MNAAGHACAERLRIRFAALVPPGNIETLYLRPVIEEARRISWTEGQADPDSRLVALGTEQNLKVTLTERSRLLTDPLVSSTELRAILLGAIVG
jgi:hypothetical protein